MLHETVHAQEKDGHAAIITQGLQIVFNEDWRVTQNFDTREERPVEYDPASKQANSPPEVWIG